MKKIITILIFAAFTGLAQSSYLDALFAGAENVYFTAGTKISIADRQMSYIAGGRAGYVLDNKILFGGAAYLLVNEIETGDYDFAGDPIDISLFYSGAEVGYKFYSDSRFGYSAFMLIATGRFFDWDYWEDYYGGDVVIVLEPSFAVSAGLSEHIGLNFGAGYRLVTGVTEPYVNAELFSGPSINFSVIFGAVR